MPASPEQTRATDRPAAASSRAKRQRSSSAPSGKSWLLLADGVGADQVEIEPVADQVLGFCDQAPRLGGAPVGAAGSEADDREPALRSADRARVELGRAEGDGAGDARALALGHEEPSLRAGGREGRTLGHAPAAGLAEHRFRRVGEAVGLLRQPLGREEAGGHAQRGRQGVDRGLGGLEVERDDAGDGMRAQPMLGEHVPGEGDQRFRRCPRLGTDAERQDGRMEDEAGRLAPAVAVGDQDLGRGRLVQRQRRRAQPIGATCLDGEADHAALEESGT